MAKINKLIDEMPSVSAEKIRREFSAVMGKVDYGHTPHVVTNRGRPSMVLISVKDYEQLIDNIDKDINSHKTQ